MLSKINTKILIKIYSLNIKGSNPSKIPEIQINSNIGYPHINKFKCPL
jgi:hypothetical protein